MISTLLCILFAILYFAISLYLCRGLKCTTRNLCICAIIIALTVVLEYIYIPLPTGATLPIASMAPLMLLAILCDYRLTFLSGWVCGVLALFLIPGWTPVHWGQFFMEHMICFSCMGYVGVFGVDKRWKICCGILLASCIKLVAHTLSGVLFFSQNAWDGWGAWGYSAIYNISQNVPLCILSAVVVLALPLKTLKKMIQTNQEVRS